MSRLFHARRNMQKRLLDLIDHPSAELVADLTGGRAEDGDDVPARPWRTDAVHLAEVGDHERVVDRLGGNIPRGQVALELPRTAEVTEIVMRPFVKPPA